MKTKECLNCNKTFQTNTRTNYCSDECKTMHKKELRKKKGFEENNKKYDGMNEGKDYVTCKECGLRGTKLQLHIQMVHKMSIPEYKQKHNGAAIVCGNLLKKQSDSMKGENNPGFNHGGKFSAFSDKFIGETTKEEAIAKMKKTKNDNPQNENTKLEYYTSKGYSEQEAINILSKRQSTFSLSKCIEQLGEVEGKKRWLERQEKWLSNYKKSNFSKISQELFWGIASNLDDLNNIYFAELSEDKQPDKSGKNNEYRLKLENVLLPDFIDTKKNKIIEFDGDYWHGKIGNKTREQKRDNILINNGYEILHILETDYNKDKNGTIEKCLNFLKQ